MRANGRNTVTRCYMEEDSEDTEYMEIPVMEVVPVPVRPRAAAPRVAPLARPHDSTEEPNMPHAAEAEVRRHPPVQQTGEILNQSTSIASKTLIRRCGAFSSMVLSSINYEFHDTATAAIDGGVDISRVESAFDRTGSRITLLPAQIEILKYMTSPTSLSKITLKLAKKSLTQAVPSALTAAALLGDSSADDAPTILVRGEIRDCSNEHLTAPVRADIPIMNDLREYDISADEQYIPRVSVPLVISMQLDDSGQVELAENEAAAAHSMEIFDTNSTHVARALSHVPPLPTYPELTENFWSIQTLKQIKDQDAVDFAMFPIDSDNHIPTTTHHNPLTAAENQILTQKRSIGSRQMLSRSVKKAAEEVLVSEESPESNPSSDLESESDSGDSDHYCAYLRKRKSKAVGKKAVLSKSSSKTSKLPSKVGVLQDVSSSSAKKPTVTITPLSDSSPIVTTVSAAAVDYPEVMQVPVVEPDVPGVSATGTVEYSGRFPCVKILNLPTGYGKTLLATMSMLLFMSTRSSQIQLAEDYKAYADRIGGSLMRGSITRNGVDRIFLPNCVLVFSPKQLVGAWRDTIQANVDSIRGANFVVLPRSKGLMMPTSINLDDVASQPDRVHVFITHSGNIRNYVHCTKTNREICYGMFVMDEVDSETISYHTRRAMPLGMYTLLVTATPADIARRIQKEGARHLTYYIQELFDNPELPRSTVAECFGGKLNLFSSYQQPTVDIKAICNMIAEIYAMDITPTTVYDQLMLEISGLIPPLHAYEVSTMRTIEQVLGVAANAMFDASAELNRLERSLDVKLYGKTLGEVHQQIDMKINKLNREIGPRSFLPDTSIDRQNKVAMMVKQVERLEKIRTLMTEMESVCGICLAEMSPDSEEGAGDSLHELLLTACCAFPMCKNCVLAWVGQGRSCPKCRNATVNFAQIESKSAEDSDPEPSELPLIMKSFLSKNGKRTYEESSANVIKDMQGFEHWLQHFNFRRHDQKEAVRTILEKAREFGLTNVILAGQSVDKWTDFGSNVTEYELFKVLRPSRHTEDIGLSRQHGRHSKIKKTAGFLDNVYKGFCTNSRVRQMLILDTTINLGVEVTGTRLELDFLYLSKRSPQNNDAITTEQPATGIDAKLTDLILQVGIAENAALTQLAGRAMRLGRQTHSPVRVVVT